MRPHTQSHTDTHADIFIYVYIHRNIKIKISMIQRKMLVGNRYSIRKQDPCMFLLTSSFT